MLLMIPLIVTASSPLKRIVAEFPINPPYNLPDSIQSLVLVNRTINDNYTNITADSLQKIFYNKNFIADTVIYDIASADTSLQALGILLFESGRYDIVIPDNPFLQTNNKDKPISDALQWSEVRQLCKTFNSDAVLSADMFKTEVITKLQGEEIYDPYKEAYVKIAVAYMTIAYKALFRIYDPATEKILACKPVSDTLFWEKSASDIYSLFNNFTSVKQALSEAGINMAIDYSKQISPTWRKETRVIYTNGDDSFEQAARLADSGDWDSAITIWKELAKKSQSKSKKSKILFNLANAYEIQGDLNSAIKYANESYEIMYRQDTYDYLKILAKRKKEN